MPAAQPKTLVRDSQGRFAKGNRGGPGNPFAKQAAKLKTVFLECLSVEKMKALVNTLIDAAIDGNMTAAKLVLQYSLGKPTAGIDVCNPIPAASAASLSPSAASPTCQSNSSGATGSTRSAPATASSAAPKGASTSALASASPASTPVATAGGRRCGPSPGAENRRVSHPSGAGTNARVRAVRPPIANGFSATGGMRDGIANLLGAKELCDRTQAAPSLDRLIPEISDEMLDHAAAPIRRDPR